MLLLICYLFQDKEISVIFSEELNWSATTIGAVSEKEICQLEKREHILTEWQKEDYCNEWKRIVNENSKLRYMINGTVISCNIDRFDNEIINRLEKIGDLMANPIIPNIMFSDWIYIYLIERLEKNKRIKSSIMDDKKYIELNK